MIIVSERDAALKIAAAIWNSPEAMRLVNSMRDLGPSGETTIEVIAKLSVEQVRAIERELVKY